MIWDSLDRWRPPHGVYQLLQVLRCPVCGHDTPHEVTDVYARCCVCRRTET